MNFHNLASSDKLQMPFALSGGMKSRSSAPHARKGFLKVLANGDVVQLLDHKPMIDRLVRDGLAESIESQANVKTPLNNLIIESVITNLEAGVKLLDCQELALAKMGGVIFCRICGTFATITTINLARPCRGGHSYNEGKTKAGNIKRVQSQGRRNLVNILEKDLPP